ncbi:MAG: hypothetical protein ACK53E_02905 [Pseudanabaena sp.]
MPLTANVNSVAEISVAIVGSIQETSNSKDRIGRRIIPPFLYLGLTQTERICFVCGICGAGEARATSAQCVSPNTHNGLIEKQ